MDISSMHSIVSYDVTAMWVDSSMASKTCQQPKSTATLMQYEKK